MGEPDKVRILLIGGGLIGTRHAAHVQSEMETSLVGLVEPSDAGPRLASQLGVPCFSSLGLAVSSGMPFDAAILATPTSTHVSLALELLELDKHVLVEKPMAANLEEAKTLVEVSKIRTAKVMVGHHRRFNPYIVKLKQIIASGALGQILGVTGLWTTLKPPKYYGIPWRTDAAGGGGVISINLIHDIDLLRYLLGDIDRVYAEEGNRLRGNPVEETGAATLHFKSGAVGTFFFSDATPSPWSFEGATGENPDLIGYYGKNTYTILGSRGSVQFPELRRMSFDHIDNMDDKGWNSTLSVDPEANGAVDATVPPFTTQLQHFARVCRGTEAPNCSAGEGYKSLCVLDALKRSLTSGNPVRIEA